MFGQFSTCDLVEFQRLLWSGSGQNNNTNSSNLVIGNVGNVNNNNIITGQQQQQQQQQPQYINNQQPTIITGIQQQPGTVIATNTNSVAVQSNSMPVQRQQNFINQPSVSFTTQPTTRYIPNQPQGRVINHSYSSPHSTILIQQQQPQTQTLFSQSQAHPLDLGKQAQEARIREMVPEFEEQYFIQTSPTKNSNSGRGNQGTVHRPQPHVPTSQAISEHLSRSYPQQDLIQIHRQRMMQETQQQSKQSKKSRQNDMYQATYVEMEVDDHADDDDYAEEEEEEDDSEEEYEEEYDPSNTQGPWKCGVCHKEYKRKTNFLAHQKTHKDSDQFQCPMCPKNFSNQHTYQKHLKSHKKLELQQMQPLIPTPTSSNKRKSKAKKQQELQQAISSISGSGQSQQQYYQPHLFQFKCDFCPEQFPYAENLKAHEQQHLAESTLRCVTCEKPFLREEEFNQHLKTHLSETIWKCSMCSTQYDEYKAYKQHLDSHLPVVYKDPPPKPPEPEKPEGDKNGLDDDIIEMEEFQDPNSPKPSTSAGVRIKSPSKLRSPEKSKLDDDSEDEWAPITGRPPVKKFADNKAKYATGSNMKLTAKGASSKDIIVKKVTGAGKAIDDDDDDIVILSAPETPHRPIPIRVPPVMRKVTSAQALQNLKAKAIQHRSSAPIIPPRKPPPVAKKAAPGPKSKSKQKGPSRPPPAPAKPKQGGRPKSLPATVTTKLIMFSDDEVIGSAQYEFQCMICKNYFTSKPERQQHILDQHCSQKSVEIKLLKLEDDPELDLEIIDEAEAELPELELRDV